MKKETKDTKRRFSFSNLKAEIKQHKAAFAVYVALRAIVVAAMVLSLLRHDYESFFVCTLSLILFLVPAFVEKNFDIGLPSTLQIIILLFIFSAEILGEMQSFYIKYAWWDTMLHTLNGFLCAAIGFALVDILNRNERIKFQLSPLFLAIVAFCFSMTVGIFWEFFECGVDLLLHTDMQKDTVVQNIYTVTLDPTRTNTVIPIENITAVTVNSTELGLGGYLDIGLLDTMKDLFVNFIGALVFSIIGFFYVKGRGKGNRFIQSFIPTIRNKKTEDT